MIEKEEILKTLEEKYIGMNWDDIDHDEIICDFEDYEEDGETDVIISDKDYFTNAVFTVAAYINSMNSIQFIFWCRNNIVESVLMQ